MHTTGDVGARPARPPATLRPRPLAERFIAATDPGSARERGETVLGLTAPAGQPIWTAQVEISPAQAKRLLLAMPVQRPVQPANVAFFTTLIRNGEFELTHQGIAFNGAGMLIDGQHRLQACIDCNEPITVLATFGLPNRTFGAMDRGRNRSAGDDLLCEAIVEHKNAANVMTGAAKILWNLDGGRVPHHSGKRGAFTNSRQLAVIHDHPLLHEAVAIVSPIQNQFRGIGGATVAGFMTRFLEINPARAKEFVEQLATGYGRHGAGLPLGSPTATLRDYTRHTDSARAKLVRGAAMVALVRAWNAFIEGRPLRRISGVMREEGFPEISTGLQEEE